VQTPIKRTCPPSGSEASIGDTERIESTLNRPKIGSRLKLKADIEQALQALNTINKNDSPALFSAMKQLIDLQQNYIKMLENPESKIARIPKAFDHLQESLDKFNLQTRSKRRMLSHFEHSNYPLATNLQQELAFAECDHISVETYNSQ